MDRINKISITTVITALTILLILTFGSNPTQNLTEVNTTTPVNWIGKYRDILNSYGANYVGVEEMTNGCAGSDTPPDACTNPGGFIKINQSLEQKTQRYKEWAIMHEFAHIRQFEVMDKLENNSDYKRLFNENIEELANAMAFAKGKTPYDILPYSKAEVEFANKVWNKTL